MAVNPDKAHFCTAILPPKYRDRTKAAVLDRYRWPAGSQITIRFLEGDEVLQERVKAVAQEWVRPETARSATIIPHQAIWEFRKSGFFKEFVIWFDGCLDRAGSDAGGEIVYLQSRTSLSAAAPVFEAYAAHPRLKTVETPDDSGIVRGVFTRALLEGLQGEAADPDSGVIDGLSLKSYLENTMEKYLPDSEKEKPLVDRKPWIRTDDRIVFGPMKEIMKTKVRLNLGVSGQGAEARLWGREPKSGSVSLLKTQRVDQGVVEFELPSGIYAVEVPLYGVRKGFEVSARKVTELSLG